MIRRLFFICSLSIICTFAYSQNSRTETTFYRQINSVPAKYITVYGEYKTLQKNNFNSEFDMVSVSIDGNTFDNLLIANSTWTQSELKISFGPMAIAREIKSKETPGEVKKILECILNNDSFPNYSLGTL